MSAPRITVSRDCHGGRRVVEVTLPRAPDPVHLHRLAEHVGGADVRIFDALPRPFFRLDVPGRFLLTGILDTPEVRFTMRRSLAAEAEAVALEACDALCREAA